MLKKELKILLNDIEIHNTSKERIENVEVSIDEIVISSKERIENSKESIDEIEI